MKEYVENSHFASEMVRQSTIRVENGQVSSTNIAHAQLLVSRSAGRVCELLKVALEKNSWCKRINIVYQHTSFSDFSLFNASMACISFIDSSTFPCSPAQSQYSPTNTNESVKTTYPMPQSFPFHPELQAQFQQFHASVQQRRVSIQPQSKNVARYRPG